MTHLGERRRLHPWRPQMRASLTRPPHGLTAHHGARRRIVLSCAHRVLSARAVDATIRSPREDPTPQGLRVTKPPPPSDAALAWSAGLRGATGETGHVCREVRRFSVSGVPTKREGGW